MFFVHVGVNYYIKSEILDAILNRESKGNYQSQSIPCDPFKRDEKYVSGEEVGVFVCKKGEFRSFIPFSFKPPNSNLILFTMYYWVPFYYYQMGYINVLKHTKKYRN